MPSQVPMVSYLVLDDPPYLSAHACEHCDALFLDRRNACASCGHTDFTSRRLRDEGTVRAFTIVHRTNPGLVSPYTAVVVDLDDGGVVKANLLGVAHDPAAINLGMRVRLTSFVASTDDEGTEAVAFAFEPI